MREIKFRVWDGDRYVYPNLIGWYGDECTCWHDDGFLDTKELEQFTGLHDKYGKEIYEGDILQYLRGSNNRLDSVSFEQGCFFCGYHYGSSTKKTKKLIQSKTCVVIGNIHENPELING